MTNEEARVILAFMGDKTHNEDEKDALLMAMDALKADGDMISRADAIEAVQTYLNILINSRRHGDDFTFINVLTDIRNNISALPSAEAVEVKAEQLPPKVPTEWINDGMVLVPQHDWIEMQKELEGYVSAEAVQGEWTDIDDYYRMATCSRCHKVTMFEKWGEYTKPYDFCPNCGARMKGGDNE